jgi:pimeloyl-ACP methyl ester carboxylesterase
MIPGVRCPNLGRCPNVGWLTPGILLMMLGFGEAAAERWKTAQAPRSMPAPVTAGTVEVRDVKLYVAQYGAQDRPPLVLLHGGLGSGDDFAAQVPALAEHFRVIVVDGRGHGRSTRGAEQLGYHAMAEDVVGTLDALRIDRAALLGWSDGGVIALDLAIHHPARVDRIVVTGTNFDRSGLRKAGTSRTFAAYTAHCVKAYRRMSPAPADLPTFRKQLRAMWKREPAFTAEQLGRIESALLVAHAEHDEIIRRDHAERLAELVPQAKLVVLPDVSHFAMWQDPEGFNRVALEFLLPPR